MTLNGNGKAWVLRLLHSLSVLIMAGVIAAFMWTRDSVIDMQSTLTATFGQHGIIAQHERRLDRHERRLSVLETSFPSSVRPGGT